ncbi:MAG: hypothetical protein AAF612_07705 [Planctomycetota bacterium]
MRFRTALLGLMLGLSTPAWAQPAGPGVGQQGAQPLAVAEGDGVRMEVFTFAQGQVSGRFFTDGQYVPFRGTMTTQGGANVIQGTVDFQGQAYPFTTRQADATTVNLSVAGDRYVMRVVPSGVTPGPAPQPEPHQTVNPGPGAGPSMNSTEGWPEQVQLVRHEIPDPWMGNATAHTMWLPKGWRFEHKQVIWRPAQLPMPEKMVVAVSPTDDVVAWLPAIKGKFERNTPQYIASQRQWGVQVPETVGEAPPTDVGRYLADFFGRSPAVTGMRVTKAERIPQLEQVILSMPQARIPNNGLTGPPQIWALSFEAVEEGKPVRSEAIVMYMTPGPGLHSPVTGSKSYRWSIFFLAMIGGPAEGFEQRNSFLWTLASTMQDDPRWRMASNQAFLEMARQNLAQREAMFRASQRAIAIRNQISDDQVARWRKDQESKDYLHHQQMQALYGVQDYETTSGERISLPTAFDHVYQSRNTGEIVISKKPVLNPVAMGMEQLMKATGRPQ